MTSRAGKVDPVPPISKQAQELMELAVDAAQSRKLPEFLERFALRAARMLNSEWGGVAVFRGRETDLYEGTEGEKSASTSFASWIISTARESREAAAIRTLSRADAASRGLAGTSTHAVFVPINASDGERLGMLCLLRRRKTLDAREKKLLHALASHAALSLENFRRFSQLEKSKR
ncbi:MAG TPA: GAF domain-containing protein, partial [Candidatus Acidoferrum sp.]|nr:GAF domain-containing protein [Candidatus Acidoferrum sp.]